MSLNFKCLETELPMHQDFYQLNQTFHAHTFVNIRSDHLPRELPISDYRAGSHAETIFEAGTWIREIVEILRCIYFQFLHDLWKNIQYFNSF